MQGLHKNLRVCQPLQAEVFEEISQLVQSALDGYKVGQPSKAHD